MRTKKNIYIIYNYNKMRDDLEYIKEYYTLQAIKKDFKIKNIRSLYHYIIKDIEDPASYKNLLNNKYIIIKE